MGQALRNVCCCDITFLNQMIQFYSNNMTNLCHLTSPQYAVLPRNIEITDYCDVTSPYV